LIEANPEALMQQVIELWNTERWQLRRDTRLHENRHPYNGIIDKAKDTLRTGALSMVPGRCLSWCSGEEFIPSEWHPGRSDPGHQATTGHGTGANEQSYAETLNQHWSHRGTPARLSLERYGLITTSSIALSTQRSGCSLGEEK
jgi:hypothetical protein